MSATVEQLRKGVASLLFAALMRCIAQLPMLGSNAAAEMALQGGRNTRPGKVVRMIRRATGCMHACKAAHWRMHPRSKRLTRSFFAPHMRSGGQCGAGFLQPR